jgi:HSF-type DNA-binding
MLGGPKPALTHSLLFLCTILSSWFRQSQFASFLRQLNMYGFIRIKSGTFGARVAKKALSFSPPNPLCAIKVPTRARITTRNFCAASHSWRWGYTKSSRAPIVPSRLRGRATLLPCIPTFTKCPFSPNLSPPPPLRPQKVVSDYSPWQIRDSRAPEKNRVPRPSLCRRTIPFPV